MEKPGIRFDYAPPAREVDAAAGDEVGRRHAPAVSIFADRDYLRAEMAEDAIAVGLRITQSTELSRLIDQCEDQPLSDVMLIDCPVLGGAEMAALARVDIRAAQAGVSLVVSTSMDALEDVFGCIEQAEVQILVAPSRAERVLALGQVLGRKGNCVRDLSEEDRLTLLRLTEQVGQIAHKLEALSGRPTDDEEPAAAFRFRSSSASYRAPGELRPGEGTERLVRAARPPLPDPRLLRRIIRQRQIRSRFFDGDLFADPAWDMLLDLTAARAEHMRVSVTSLCIASGVPPTTALRWVGQMTVAGLFQRVEDETDRRRAFITLSDTAAESMARYFAELGAGAASVV
jgi:hypothetical protein